MQRNAPNCPTPRPCGFTLLELLISVAIATLILAIGIPAFNSLSARSQQTAEINSLVRHLQLARSSAIKTGNHHVLCPSKDMLGCLGDTRWESGYILFEDRNQDAIRDPHETLVRVSRPTGNFDIAMQTTAGRKLVIYRADGRSAGSNLTLTFCDPGKSIQPKAVILSNSGRTRVSTTRWDGTPLTCGN